jgi:hypothetical protein
VIERGLATGSFEREQAWRTATVLAASIVAAIAAGFLAGGLANVNKTPALAAILVLFVPFVAWRRLLLAVMVVAFLAIVVEQYRIGVPGGDLTDHIPLFTSLSDGFNLSGVYFNPMEALLFVVLVILLIRAGQHQVRLPATALALGVAALVGVVLTGAVHGVIAGGDYKMALWEIRPTIYIAVMYFLATQLPDRLETVNAFLWTFVATVAIKSLQGSFLVFSVVLAGGPHPDFLLGHEDSVFFVLFLVLAAGLWLFRQKGALRRVATALVPLVILVNLANSRRVSWLQLGACSLVLLVLVWVRLPDRRRLVVGVLVAIAIVCAIYLPLYWNQTGLLGQPARAVHSMISPDPRDAASDLYRLVENANLQLNIKRSPFIGLGYGIPIDYVIPIVDLSRIDPFIKYIPHNTLLYVWMRVGALGALVFWSFIGFAIVSACRLLRARDPRLALYGAVAVCALVNYLIEGYLDLGLFWFRVAMIMGCMLGVLEVARRVQAAEPAGDEARKGTAARPWRDTEGQPGIIAHAPRAGAGLGSL